MQGVAEHGKETNTHNFYFMDSLEITESAKFCEFHSYLQYYCQDWCIYGLGT